MTPTPARTPSGDLLGLLQSGPLGGLADGQLLERFAGRSEREAELAFEALVERHGAMVLRACRGILRDDHEALDAFQATFLILMRRGRSLWVRDSLGPWLHRVACRAAAKAKAQRARRRALGRQAAELLRADQVGDGRDERAAALHEELDRLPDRLRVPIVLCDLEGRTCEDAARILGRSVRTVRNWRARGRDRLRARLAGRGLAGGGPAHAPLFPPSEPIAGAMVEALARGGVRIATAGASLTPAAALTEGVLRSMLLTRFKSIAASLGICAGVAGVLYASQAPSPTPDGGAEDGRQVATELPGIPLAPQPDAAGKPEDRAIWHLTLREAIRLELGTHEDVRTGRSAGASGDGLVISPVERMEPAGERLQRFGVGLMAHVRSVERAYWDLARCYAQLHAREEAVRLGEEVVDRERSERGTGPGARVALEGVEGKLEGLRLALVASTSDVITAERTLRVHIGIPGPDGRRIIPCDSPKRPKAEGRWEDDVAEIQGTRPLPARTGEGGSGEGGPGGPGAASGFRTTRIPAKYLADVGDKHRQYQVGVRLREAADHRCEAQRAFFDEGKITADRYLDVIGMAANAAAQDAACLAAYNDSLVVIEDFTRTLLRRRNIVVAPGSGPDHSRPLDEAKATLTRADPGAEPGRAPLPDPASSKTISFRFTVGSGPGPLEVRGSFSIGPTSPSADAAR